MGNGADRLLLQFWIPCKDRDDQIFMQVERWVRIFTFRCFFIHQMTFIVVSELSQQWFIIYLRDTNNSLFYLNNPRWIWSFVGNIWLSCSLILWNLSCIILVHPLSVWFVTCFSFPLSSHIYWKVNYDNTKIY